MKNYIKRIIKSIRKSLRKGVVNLTTKHAYVKLVEQRGQFVMEHAVVFVIILVLAAIAIAILTAYMQGDFQSLITSKISAFFS